MFYDEAEVDNSAIIGDFSSRVEASSDEGSAYGKLARYDRAQEGAGHAEMHRMPAGVFAIVLTIETAVPAASSGSCARFKAPRPLTIWAAELSCESAAGATGTVDLLVDDGVTDASILDAAEDVKTGAGVSSRVAPEAGSQDVAFDSEIYITGASGAGGTLVGGRAILWVQFQ